MLPSRRQVVLRMLVEARAPAGGDVVRWCRDTEATIHAASVSEDEYYDVARRALFNLHTNPHLNVDPVHSTDETLAQGTLRERISQESAARQHRFRCMIQEKYEELNDRTYQAIVRCKRCGSSEVSWDEKQTRAADEAASLFCVCNTCHKRWVMR